VSGHRIAFLFMGVLSVSFGAADVIARDEIISARVELASRELSAVSSERDRLAPHNSILVILRYHLEKENGRIVVGPIINQALYRGLAFERRGEARIRRGRGEVQVRVSVRCSERYSGGVLIPRLYYWMEETTSWGVVTRRLTERRLISLGPREVLFRCARTKIATQVKGRLVQGPVPDYVILESMYPLSRTDPPAIIEPNGELQLNFRYRLRTVERAAIGVRIRRNRRREVRGLRTYLTNPVGYYYVGRRERGRRHAVLRPRFECQKGEPSYRISEIVYALYAVDASGPRRDRVLATGTKRVNFEVRCLYSLPGSRPGVEQGVKGKLPRPFAGEGVRDRLSR